MSDSSTPQAGWYADPENPAAERWWNGSTWSESRRDSTTGGATAVPPVPPVPSPGVTPPVPPADNSGFTFGSVVQMPARVDPYAPAPAPGYAAPGYTTSPYVAAPYGTPGQGVNGLALAGLIVSCAGWLVISLLGPIAGIVLSALGLQAAKRRELMGNPNSGRGMAMAGLVVGIAVLILGIGRVVLFIVVTLATSTYRN